MRLVLIGPPGSGKGTLGQSLSAHLGIPHITTGGMIRDEIARKTPLGKRFDGVIARGDFIPDSDIIPLVQQRLGQPDAKDGFILDGFPRDLAQARRFAKTQEGGRLDAVIVLELTEPAIIRRLTGRLVCPRCGRSYQERTKPADRPKVCDQDGTTLVRRPDDAPEAVAHRIGVYRQVTLPVVDYYRQLGLAMEFDAEPPPEVIFDQIVRALKQKTDLDRV